MGNQNGGGQKPVPVLGYPSISAAVRGLGIDRKTILRHRARNSLDRIGKYHNQPVTICGVTYRTKKEAAANFGVAHETVCEWARKGQDCLDRMGARKKTTPPELTGGVAGKEEVVYGAKRSSKAGIR
jgi:hypothetical protein